MLLNSTVLLACKLGKSSASLIDWNFVFLTCSGLYANWLIPTSATTSFVILFKCVWAAEVEAALSLVCVQTCVCMCVSACSVSAELPVVSLSGCSGGDGVVVGPSSGSEPPVRSLLEQLVELWEGDRCSSAPLHLLFTPLTITAVLKASDTEVCLPLLLWLIHNYANFL